MSDYPTREHLPLFDSQPEHLERVTSRIGKTILAWFRLIRSSRVGCTFHMDEMVGYVQSEIGHVAPNSPARVMQDMRKKGQLNYRVVSRKESLYEVL